MEPKLSTLLNYIFKFIPKTRVKGYLNTVARRTVKMALTPPDPGAVRLIDQFFSVLQIPDDAQRVQAVVPLVHKSLLFQDKTGVTLDRNIREFSYPRAIRAMNMYQHPVHVTEVQRGQVCTIGFKDSGERGRVDKYFIAKLPSVAGRPAPIDVFFPESGGQPSLVNFGSL
jgi:hypothetical protein